MAWLRAEVKSTEQHRNRAKTEGFKVALQPSEEMDLTPSIISSILPGPDKLNRGARRQITRRRGDTRATLSWMIRCLCLALAAGSLVACGDHGSPPTLVDDPGAASTGGHAGAGSGGAAGSSGAWMSDRSTLVASVPLGLYESEPHLARGPAGQLAAAYISLAGRRSVALTTSQDDGATWAPLSLLEDPDGRQGVDPSVAIDAAGALTVVFLGLRYDSSGSKSDRRVFVVRSPSVGGPLSPPETLDEGAGGEALDKPWITALPDGLLVTWTSDSGSWVRTARRGNGPDWARSTIMPDGQLRGLSYPCAGSALLVHVAYLTPAGVFVSSSEDGGLTFPRTTQVNAPGEVVAFVPPSCAASDDRLWVSYGTEAAPGTDLQAALVGEVHVARSVNAGHTFTAPRRALGPGAFLNPQMIRDPGGKLAVAAYAQSGAADGFMRVAASTDEGESFTVAGDLAGPMTFERNRIGFGWLGDYFGLSLADNTLRFALVDNATQPKATQSRVRFVSARLP